MFAEERVKRFCEVPPKSHNPEKLRTLSEAEGSHSLPCTVDRGGVPAPDEHCADLLRAGVGEREHAWVSKGPGGCPSE